MAIMFSLPLFASLLPLLTHAQVSVQTVNIMNNCPNTIEIFQNHVWIQESIAPHGAPQVIKSDADIPLSLSASANNGTLVGINFLSGEYFIVKNASFFDVGVSILPADASPSNGFCDSLSCDSASCTTAFTTIPRLTDQVPSSPPPVPLLACPTATIWNVTFCPGGTQADPGSIPRAIHPGGRPDLCVDVQGNVQSLGTPVQVFGCNGSPAQQWLISKGNTQVRLAGTNFCLDAGSNLGNGVPMKIWQCFDGLPQQSWFYTDDERIAVVNQGLCLDVTNGNFANGQVLQTFKCTDNDQNQEFTD